MTLVEFLTARLEEDERYAKAAALAGSPDDQQFRPGHVDHIARHDPARVLREVEAKRRLVHSYGKAARYRDEADARAVPGERLSPQALAERDQLNGEVAALRWTLQALALPYADHADYDESWRI